MSDFFGSAILAKGDLFWMYERHQDFFLGGKRKQTEGFSWVLKKGLRDFLGYAKNSSNFFWVDKF